MAGFQPLDGAMPTLSVAPDQGSGVGGSVGARLSAGLNPSHGLVGIVLAAVIVLLILDKAGFRFAVTVGRS